MKHKFQQQWIFSTLCFLLIALVLICQQYERMWTSTFRSSPPIDHLHIYWIGILITKLCFLTSPNTLILTIEHQEHMTFENFHGMQL